MYSFTLSTVYCYRDIKFVISWYKILVISPAPSHIRLYVIVTDINGISPESPITFECYQNKAMTVGMRASAHGQGDLRITVRASPSSASPRASHSSRNSHPLVFPDKLTGSSDRAGSSILFEPPLDTRMSIAVFEGEPGSGDDDSAALPVSGSQSPNQIQRCLLCFPSPLRVSVCTGGLLLLPKARGWTIGSWECWPTLVKTPYSKRVFQDALDMSAS